jgi:hypothetical protein
VGAITGNSQWRLVRHRGEDAESTGLGWFGRQALGHAQQTVGSRLARSRDELPDELPDELFVNFRQIAGR